MIQLSTVMPIERAVPAMIFAAWSMSCALRSVSLVLAISRTWSQVTLATLVLCGSPEPFSTPAALSSRRAAGGVFSLKSNDRSSYTEISTGTTIPVVITVYEDRSFTFITKTPPAAVLIKQAAGIEKGSGEPHKDKVGTISQDQIRAIAEKKLPDLNAHDVDQAAKIIAGTARSMGVEVA